MPTQPRRWVTLVPILGLVVQLGRMRRAFRWLDTPAHLRDRVRPVDFNREQAQLFVAVVITAGTLVGVILAMIALQLMGMSR